MLNCGFVTTLDQFSTRIAPVIASSIIVFRTPEHFSLWNKTEERVLWLEWHLHPLKSGLFEHFDAAGIEFLVVMGRKFVSRLNAKEISRLVVHLNRKELLSLEMSLVFLQTLAKTKKKKKEKPFSVQYCWEQGKRHRPTLHSDLKTRVGELADKTCSSTFW